METVKNAAGGKKGKWGKNRKVKSKKLGKTEMGKNGKSTTNKKGLLNAH